MMNADLAEVSKKHGQVGHPLRNRSQSSNSRDGSQSKPDPNRYKKYLSLRNRKIVENKLRSHEESSSQHTASLRNLESQQDQMKPVQPILKQSSSRVSDLRYREGSLPRTYSTESLQNQTSGIVIDHPRSRDGHSPLRVKTPQSDRSRREPHLEQPRKSPATSARDVLDKQSEGQQSTRSPIAVYNNVRGNRADAEESKKYDRVRENFASMTSQESRHQFQKSSRSRRNDQFKSTTEVEDSEFNFDFDQDGACSYVNTTMQSEKKSPMNAEIRPRTTGHNSHHASQKSVGREVQQTATFAAEVNLVDEPAISQKKSSIHAYEDELRERVHQAQRSENQSEAEESSGYVIDYEQVLKDESLLHSRRHEMEQNTILEQTQEALETSSESQNADERPLTDHILESTGKLDRNQDSPQFRADSRIMQDLQNRRGSKESPLIQGSSGKAYKRSSDYEITTQIDTEPIMSFENRQPASTKQTNTGRFGESSRRQADSEAKATFRPHQAFQPLEEDMDTEEDYERSTFDRQMTNDHTGQIQSRPNLQSATEGFSAQGQASTFKKNILLSSETLTPPLEGSTSEYDLATTNKKIQRANEELDAEFEKQTQGGSSYTSNLVVTCIIRQPMDTVGIKSKYKSLHSGQPGAIGNKLNGGFDPIKELSSHVLTTARTSKSYAKDGGCRSVNSSSVGPVINPHGLNKSGMGPLDITRSSVHSANRSASRPRVQSHDTRSNNSAGGGNKRNQKSVNKAGTIPNGYKHPHILTTMKPSKYVLRSPPGLQAQLLNILLKSEQDIKHCELAFDEHGIQSKIAGRKGMKVFEFDNCVGETKGHSLSIGVDQNIRWVTQSRNTAAQVKVNGKTKNVIFLFGQTDALKSQLLNVMQGNSMINQCLREKDIRFMRVSMYHLGQEYLLAHKSFGNKQQMRREIGMELREAYRERDLNAKKIALKFSTYSKTLKAEQVKLASHLIIQLDDLVIVDLADIDNLKDPSMAKKISADFSVVTNAILAMSNFYKDHDFGNADEDRLAPYRDTNSLRSGSLSFSNQMSRLITRKSKVLLLCCVIQCSVAGTQAVDYCHKIRSYYHGTPTGTEATNQTPTRRMMQVNGNPDVSIETDQNVNAFKQLGGLISEVSKARLFIDKIFANKARGEPLKRSRNQLKEMVSCLRDDVSDLLNSLAANNESYVHQLKKVREMLQAEIYYMREKVAAMRSLGRKASIGGSSHKSGHALCLLPRNSQILSVSQNNQRQTSQPKQQLRPQSQTSLHSNNHGGGSQPGSSRMNSSRNGRAAVKRMPAHSNQRENMSNTRTSNERQQSRQRSQSRNKSQSQSKRNTASKNFGYNPNANLTPVNAQLPYSPREGPLSVNESSNLNRRESSTTKMRRSTESLHSKGGHNGNMSRAEKGSFSQQNLKGQRRMSATKKGGRVSSRNRPKQTQETRVSSSKVQSDPMHDQNTFTNASYNNDLMHVNVDQDGQGIIVDQGIGQVGIRNSLKSSGFSTQQIVLPANSGPDADCDFRKQTLSDMNQNFIISAQKNQATSSTVQESTSMPLAGIENLHQEIYDLKQQLREAITLSEDQSKKRQQAEENCIDLTKDLAMSERTVDDLQDRIVAKDQTIRSLESQVDFFKEKMTQQQQSVAAPSQYQQQPYPGSTQIQPSNDGSRFEELEELKKEKAQTDQMNQQILGQISMLKDALSTFKDQDRINQKQQSQQSIKDQEMSELKEQVQQLMKINNASGRTSAQDAGNYNQSQIRQELAELERVKEKYRQEALTLKKQVRQQQSQNMPNSSRSVSKERMRSISSNKRRKESQDREPLHVHTKLASSNTLNKHHSSQQQHQDQQAMPQHMPQQKSLNTIKNMIKDFKEQRKGLMRTTSSREAINQAARSGAPGFKRATNKPQRSSKSRENDDREMNKQLTHQNSHQSSGYASLNQHFR